MADSEQSSAKHRDHYLQTLGIVQYVPKELAQETVANSLVEDRTDTKKPAIKTLEQKAKLSHQSTIEALLQTDAEKSPHKQSEDHVKSQVKNDSPSEKLALQLVFWQATDAILIATSVDRQLPDSQQVQLLSNIIATIDNQVSGLPQYDVVNWPPHSSMQGGELEAREFLSTLINSKLAAKPTKLLLILGESAQDWLLSMAQKKSVNAGMVLITPDVTALITPALDEMLEQPQSKRITWQIICQYLNNTAVSH